jgi:hypothetical protein
MSYPNAMDALRAHGAWLADAVARAPGWVGAAARLT